MDSRSGNRRRTAIGFVVALGILGVLVYVVGIGDVVAAMAAADVAVPVALVPVAELIPLPGGVGPSESLLVVLLVASTGVPPGGATAGILVHRGATYWLPVVLGGGVSPLVLERPN